MRNKLAASLSFFLFLSSFFNKWYTSCMSIRNQCFIPTKQSPTSAWAWSSSKTLMSFSRHISVFDSAVSIFRNLHRHIAVECQQTKSVSPQKENKTKNNFHIKFKTNWNRETIQYGLFVLYAYPIIYWKQSSNITVVID